MDPGIYSIGASHAGPDPLLVCRWTMIPMIAHSAWPGERITAHTLHPSTSRSSAAGQPINCIKYNKYEGDCKFGQGCKYCHVYSICEEPHSMSKCAKGSVEEKILQQ